ncbi:Retrotransposon-derived protein PEG10 [Ceratobasidium sp. AG-Ba]|nr:Retrotransposon-derived protein PEG10 [Ceratobasidium sp. AG-Ba]
MRSLAHFNRLPYAPEEFSGKKGNTAMSFILDCKTYFDVNTSSFPTHEAKIMCVLMNLEEGILKQWGQYYLNKLLAGDQDQHLDSWQAFQAEFVANWSDPAALQVAERRINKLKQTALASDHATEFRVIAGGELEWSNSALMAASTGSSSLFCPQQAHKAHYWTDNRLPG